MYQKSCLVPFLLADSGGLLEVIEKAGGVNHLSDDLLSAPEGALWVRLVVFAFFSGCSVFCPFKIL